MTIQELVAINEVVLNNQPVVELLKRGVKLNPAALKLIDPKEGDKFTILFANTEGTSVVLVKGQGNLLKGSSFTFSKGIDLVRNISTKFAVEKVSEEIYSLTAI